ncbi:TonB-dependent hemoglobin/transferrin/lactoferrin family receptor [Roseovarius aestuarii]|nr:TonB-dependent hemoglobin/transferrin/lactoferrin family receptor [Roseovarius aestuarii]
MTKLSYLNTRASLHVALGACLATSSTAQEQAIDLGQILLSTDRANRNVRELPANVTVVGEDEIEDHGISDMQELVRNVPGVTVGRQTTGADPFSTFGGFTIRGVGGNRVAIQIDGSRVPERIIDGTRDYLDFNFTKQVEIVRGPASVQWGADALGGLVALETIDPEDLLEGRDRAVNVKGGFDSSSNTTSTSLSYGQRFSPDFSMLIGVARDSGHEPELSNARDDGGIYGCTRNIAYGATSCGDFDPTDSTSTRTLLKAVWTPGTQHRLEFSADLLRRDTDVVQNYSLGPVINNTTGVATGEIIDSKTRNLDLNRDRYGIEYTFTPDSGIFSEVKTTFAYTPNGYERTGFENSTSAAGDRITTQDALSYSEDFYELDIQATANFSLGASDHRLVMGFDGDIAKTNYSRRDVETNLTTGTVTETRAGGFNFANATTQRADIYVEDRITFGGGRFELTPGLRFATYKIDPSLNADYQTVPGKEPVVRQDERLLKSLGATYRFNDNWSAWAKYGEGFKMPTAQQLYTSSPGFFNLIPAPNLSPEEVESYEVGLRYEQSGGFASINAFRAKYSNFIESFYFVPGTNDITYRNIAKVDIWGIEASGGMAIGANTNLSFAAAWQKGEQRANPTSAKTATTLPPFTASVTLSHVFPAYGVTVEGVASFAGDVKRTDSATDFKPDGYALLDLYAKWEVMDNAFLKFGVQNVTNERYFMSSASSYGVTASPGVTKTNPIELQTGAGRTFNVGFDVTF